MRIRCPFHGWTYGLDGALRGATRMGATCAFRHADMGLVELRAAERGGFAFVALSGEAPGIDEWLGAFDALHAPWRLEELVTTRRRELEVACNWKLFLEVFNESYHLEFVHAATFGGIYLEPDLPDAVGGCVQSSFSPTAGTGGLKADEQAHALPPMPESRPPGARGHPLHLGLPLPHLRGGERGAVGLCRAPSRSRPLRGDPMGVLSARDRRLARLRGEGRALLQRAWTRRSPRTSRCSSASSSAWTSPFARPGRWSDLEQGAAAFAAWYAERLAL